MVTTFTIDNKKYDYSPLCFIRVDNDEMYWVGWSGDLYLYSTVRLSCPDKDQTMELTFAEVWSGSVHLGEKLDTLNLFNGKKPDFYTSIKDAEFNVLERRILSGFIFADVHDNELLEAAHAFYGIHTGKAVWNEIPAIWGFFKKAVPVFNEIIESPPGFEEGIYSFARSHFKVEEPNQIMLQIIKGYVTNGKIDG